jgi:hypothetical protein
MSKGFEIGKDYHSPKVGQGINKDYVASSTVWKLISIDSDATVVLQAYSNIGALTDERQTIDGALLHSNFIPSEKSFKMLVKYPKTEGKYNASMKEDILAGRIKECLMVQAELMVEPDLTKDGTPPRYPHPIYPRIARGLICQGRRPDRRDPPARRGTNPPPVRAWRTNPLLASTNDGVSCGAWGGSAVANPNTRGSLSHSLVASA